jgi:hypothetical protein
MFEIRVTHKNKMLEKGNHVTHDSKTSQTTVMATLCQTGGSRARRSAPARLVLFKCRFTIRVWTKVKQWLGLHDIDPSTWHARRNVKDWWTEAIRKEGPSKKAMASLVMLINLEGKECTNLSGHQATWSSK